MSILVKGMDMPGKGKERCIIIRPDGTIRTFNDVKIEYLDAIAVPIPTPHGRLIDAEALLRVMATEYKRIAETYGENDEYALCLKNYAISMVTSAPTIIEAEE